MTSVGNFVRAARAITAATRATQLGKGAAKIGFAAADLSRNINTTFTRLEAIGEAIDIGATRSRLVNTLDRIERLSSELQFLHDAYQEAGYNC